jgi:GNAT superfamily N-acetyltransferase
MEILRARPEDAAELTEIAMLAKAHWGYPQRWLDLWRITLTVDEDTIRKQRVYLAAQDGRTIGFYALIGSPPALDLDQLWIRPEWIGKGVGRILVQHALELAILAGAERVDVQAEPHAEGFYQKMGARRVGEYSYELDGQLRVLPKMVFDIQTKSM